MNTSASVILKELVEGNKRFVAGVRSISALTTPSQRQQLADQGQKPKAIVLCCSDSRAPAEIVFDVGLGELFVVRVAGNIVAPSLIASIEFAAMNFGTPLVIVMGHTDCGAIRTAIKVKLNQAKIPTENIADLISEIEPSLDHAIAKKSMHATDDLVAHAVLCNVEQSAARLISRSSVIRDLVSQDKLAIVGGVYDIATGVVNFCEDLHSELKRISLSKTPYEYANFGKHQKVDGT